MSARANSSSAQADRASARLPGAPKNPCSTMSRRVRSLTDTSAQAFWLGGFIHFSAVSCDLKAKFASMARACTRAPGENIDWPAILGFCRCGTVQGLRVPKRIGAPHRGITVSPWRRTPQERRTKGHRFPCLSGLCRLSSLHYTSGSCRQTFAFSYNRPSARSSDVCSPTDSWNQQHVLAHRQTSRRLLQ